MMSTISEYVLENSKTIKKNCLFNELNQDAIPSEKKGISVSVML